MSFREVLSFCSVWSVIVPIITGLLFLKFLNYNSKLILLLVVFAGIPQLMFAFVSKQTLEMNLVYNTYTLVEFALMMLFFYRLKIFAVTNIFFILSMAVFASTAFYLILTYGASSHFFSELVFLSNFIYTGWILFYLYTILIKESSVFSFKVAETWYLTAYFLYSPCSALVFLFWNQRNGELSILKDIGFVQNFFNIVLYLFIAMGFIADYVTNKHVKK